ncbi:arrestin domain-containing protein 17-like [Ylistrum balloti]|uniref:arrestin domain-containing protein 17-like n=1 Tax=Ylistrum balloti TaxID=509963 RepID=UPI002905ED46|nr:arrestin domain-containing protein 17-like [Ylistrum balloti]
MKNNKQKQNKKKQPDKKEEKKENEQKEEEEEKPNVVTSLIKEGSLILELITLRDDGTLHAGDLVKVSVKLQLTKPLSVKEFKIHLRGYIKTRWTDTVGPKKKLTYGVHKDVVKLEEDIKSSNLKPSQDGSLTFGQGFYFLPVKFDLPPDVMPSFESNRGFVRYYLSVRGIVEDKPILFHLQKIKVIVPLDLSKDPLNMIPLRFIEHQDVVACCCSAGKLKGRFQVDRRAYIPGEFITLTAMITNHTKKQMKYTKCSLTLKMTYIKDNWTQKCKKTVLAFQKHGPTKAGEIDYWEDVQLKIPSHMPPALLNCKYIQVRYILKIETEMAWSFPSKHTLFNIVLPVGHISAKPPEENEENEGEGDGDNSKGKVDELIELEV